MFPVLKKLTKQGISSNLSACPNETGVLELEGTSFFAVVNPQKTNLVWTLAQIGAIWIASDIGFYYLLPTLGVNFNFDRSPVAAAIYYAFWAGIALITFWPMYRSWSQFGRLATLENRLTSCIIWFLTFTACIFFAAYVLPLLPKIVWAQSNDSQEFKMATSVFFCQSPLRYSFSNSCSLPWCWLCVPVSHTACAKWLRLFLYDSLAVLRGNCRHDAFIRRVVQYMKWSSDKGLVRPRYMI